MNITKEAHPALWQLLHRDTVYSDVNGCPAQCADFGSDCPFAILNENKNRHKDIQNDTSEAYYNCSLLDTEVWGESPKCTPEDWMKRARQELGLTGLAGWESL